MCDSTKNFSTHLATPGLASIDVVHSNGRIINDLGSIMHSALPHPLCSSIILPFSCSTLEPGKCVHSATTNKSTRSLVALLISD
jgi:hypothetical protein